MSEQLEVPGTVPERFQEIEEAAGKYVKIRDRRMRLTEQEVDARGMLIQAMKDAKVEIYTTLDELVCVLTSTEKVKVKARAEENGDGDE